MRKEQAEREKANAPLRERLAMIDGLLADHRTRLERALNLYLEGGIAAEMLTEHKTRLEETITTLERERIYREAQIEAQTITDAQIESLYRFMRKMGEGLRKAEGNFEKQRRLFEEPGLVVRLGVGNQITRGQCSVS